MYTCVGPMYNEASRTNRAWASSKVHHIIPNEQRVPRKYETSSEGNLVTIHPHFFYPPSRGEATQSFASPSILKNFRRINSVRNETRPLYVSEQSVCNSITQLSSPAVITFSSSGTVNNPVLMLGDDKEERVLGLYGDGTVGEFLPDDVFLKDSLGNINVNTVGDFDLVDGILTPFPLPPTQHYELMIEFVSSSGRKTIKKRIPLEHDHYAGFITIRDLPMDEEGFYFFSIYERDRRHSVDAAALPTYLVRVVDHQTISHSLEQARDKVTEELRFDRTLNQPKRSHVQLLQRPRKEPK